MQGFELISDILEYRLKENGSDKFAYEIETERFVTYAELYESIKKRASHLKQIGVRKNDRIIISGANSLKFMEIWYAIVDFGAIAIPVNPSSSSKELDYIINDSGALFIVSDVCFEQSETIIRKDLCDGLYFYSIDQTMDTGNKAIDGTAMILYTSGSTGNPKGVMLTHENLICEMHNIQTAHELSRQDRVLCVLPWFHINGLVITMLTPLLVGHELYIAKKFSSSQFWNWIDRWNITWFSGVPTIYSYLLENPYYEEHSSLRFARSASSSLPNAVLEKFEDRYKVKIIESYGMTEGGSQLTSNPMPPQKTKIGSVGLPYGLDVRIVSFEGKILSAYEQGEVEFRGKSLTRGYYNKEQETISLFDGEWMRTGDIGYLDDEGYLFLVGRSKELINKGGEKFSPYEIDEVLYEMEGITMAAAVGIPDEFYGEDVIAFCVSEDKCPDEEQIKDYCRRRLTPFKVPREIYFVKEIPTGGNGKVQRLKLKDVYKKMQGGK